MSAYWGELVTSSLPRAAVGPVLDRLTHTFLRRFAAAGGASIIGKAMPFGIGAAIGGNVFFSAKDVRANRIDGQGILTRKWYSRPALPPPH